MKTNCLHTLMKMSLHASGVSRNKKKGDEKGGKGKSGNEKENMRREEKEIRKKER